MGCVEVGVPQRLITVLLLLPGARIGRAWRVCLTRLRPPPGHQPACSLTAIDGCSASYLFPHDPSWSFYLIFVSSRPLMVLHHICFLTAIDGACWFLTATDGEKVRSSLRHVATGVAAGARRTSLSKILTTRQHLDLAMGCVRVAEEVFVHDRLAWSPVWGHNHGWRQEGGYQRERRLGGWKVSEVVLI